MSPTILGTQIKVYYSSNKTIPSNEKLYITYLIEGCNFYLKSVLIR